MASLKGKREGQGGKTGELTAGKRGGILWVEREGGGGWGEIFMKCGEVNMSREGLWGVVKKRSQLEE